MSIYLNMDPGAPPVVVKASEGDIGRTFEFMLIQNGSEYEIPAGTTIKAEIRKPDGHGTEIPCTWSGSVVTLETTEQSTIRAGKGFGELRLSKDSTNIGTANFILAVEPRPVNADTDQTDSSYSQTGNPGDVWTLGSNGVPSWAPPGLDASSATAGQVLTADGAGGHYWGDVESGDTVPTEVREALFTLLNNAIYRDVDLTDEKAVIESWATDVTNISLNHTSLSFSSVRVVLLEATTSPIGVSVVWTSSNPSVATVNDGAVVPVGNGNCVITATAGSKSASCAVAVNAFASVTSISAVYSQRGYVFDTDSINSLKSNLSVTANYSDGTSQTVNNYALTGTLAAGTSQVTVAYADKTTTFNVAVSSLPANYTKYDYVRNKVYGSSNKTIIIDTKLGGVYCGTRYEHEIELALTARHAGTAGSSFYCKRAQTGTTVASRSIWNGSETSFNVQLCDRSIGTNSDVNASIQVPLGQKVNIRTAVDKVYKDGELYCTVDNNTFTSVESYTTYGIPLFGQVTANTWYGTGDEGKIYKFAVKDLETEEYVAYLVACTNPDGNAGFYDMIRQTFYTSSTPANLECGND